MDSLDSTCSFFDQLTSRELENAHEFVKAVLSFCPIGKSYAAALQDISDKTLAGTSDFTSECAGKHF